MNPGHGISLQVFQLCSCTGQALGYLRQPMRYMKEFLVSSNFSVTLCYCYCFYKPDIQISLSECNV